MEDSRGFSTLHAFWMTASSTKIRERVRRARAIVDSASPRSVAVLRRWMGRRRCSPSVPSRAAPWRTGRRDVLQRSWVMVGRLDVLIWRAIALASSSADGKDALPSWSQDDDRHVRNGRVAPMFISICMPPSREPSAGEYGAAEGRQCKLAGATTRIWAGSGDPPSHLPQQAFVAIQVDDAEVARPPRHSAALGHRIHQDLLAAADPGPVLALLGPLLHGVDDLEAPELLVAGHVVFDAHRRRSRARRIHEHEHAVEGDFFHEGDGLLELLRRLPGVADDHVRGEGQRGHVRTQQRDRVQVLPRVAASYRPGCGRSRTDGRWIRQTRGRSRGRAPSGVDVLGVRS